jgi:CLIP-associating protein 1/2
MKMLLNLIQSTDPIVIIAAVRILGRILRTDEMKSNYIRFLELMLLKLIDCYKTNKEVGF